jgi:hypothetical protein
MSPNSAPLRTEKEGNAPDESEPQAPSDRKKENLLKAVRVYTLIKLETDRSPIFQYKRYC